MKYLHLHYQRSSLGLDGTLNRFDSAFKAVDRNKLVVLSISENVVLVQGPHLICRVRT